MGIAAASAGAAGPSRDHGTDGPGAADGLSLSRMRHADDTTTRPTGSGPTRQSSARDSERPDNSPTPDEARAGYLFYYY
jgi:hypothetical protein